MALGKVEQGMIKPNQKCIIQPIGKPCIVQNVIMSISAQAGETNSINVTY